MIPFHKPPSVEPPGIAPGSSVCRTDVFLLDHGPLSAEAVGLEPTNEFDSPPVFKPVLLPRFAFILPLRSAANLASGRMTSVVVKLRELESNQRLRIQSPASLPAATVPQCASQETYDSFKGSPVARFTSCEGRNRTCGLVVQSHTFLPAETTSQ